MSNKDLYAKIIKEEKESLARLDANDKELVRLNREIARVQNDLEFLAHCGFFGFLWWKVKNIFNAG